MIAAKTFAENLFHRLIEAHFVEYTDNYDDLRFGPRPAQPLMQKFQWRLREACRQFGIHFRKWLPAPNSKSLAMWLGMIPDLEWLYRRLADEQSRAILVDIIAYRIMGHRGVRFDFAESYKKKREELQVLADVSNSIRVEFLNWHLFLYNLSELGFPISLYIKNPFTQFYLEQYAHKTSCIEADPGDVVIDGGGCYGDTALYFACKAGVKGHVHSFEFVPSNLDVFRKNLGLNPGISSRITIINKALWNSSGDVIFFRDNGPGSRTSSAAKAGYDSQTETVSIDDYVKTAHLAKVNFIKMDIEGAEKEAILGAARTIKTMHPKLAVCLYHSPEDFVGLPRLIDRLCPSYEFHIKHASIHSEETVLIAAVP